MMETNNSNIFRIEGKGWSARKVAGTYIVSIADGASVVDALTDFVRTQQVSAGQVTGIGATNEVTLRFFDPDTKDYVSESFHEQMEISHIGGNIAEIDGKIQLHLHITLGRRDYTALAGHLSDAKIRGAGEFFVYPLDTRTAKVKNEEKGLNFYDFSQ